VKTKAARNRAAPEITGLWSVVQLGIHSLRGYPLLAIVLLGATLSQGTLQGLLVWALRKVLLVFSSSNGGSSLALLIGAGVILAIWLARVFATYAGEQASVHIAHRLETDYMERLLAKLMTLSIKYFEKNSQGDLVMASYNDLKAVRTVTLAIGTVVLSVSRILGLAVVAWVLSPKLAVIGLVAVPLGLIPAHLLGERITTSAYFQRSATTTFFDSFLQLSNGFRVIKVNRAESRVLQRANEIGRELYGHVVRQAESKNVARLLMELVSGIGLVFVLIIGGRDVAANHLSWQSLLSLLIAVMAVYSPVVNLLTVYADLQASIPSLARVGQILETTPELLDDGAAEHLRDAPRTIELRDVSFAYDDRPVLDSISATFHRGETIGIVGPSGAGKSTLVALLLRLYDPQQGQILFDGTDLRNIKHADLMDRCAIVLQEPFLFLDTIENNIRIAKPDASSEEVIAAATAANVHEEIERMDLGYQTLVGRKREARGVSTGQKQRISIAAALLKNAPLLFLDEATSSLDSVSERMLQSALDRLMAGRTTFIIAHRLSTLRSADRIMVIDQGHLVGLGTHRELLDSCETYQRLWVSQMGGADIAEPDEVMPPQAWVQ